MKKSNPLTLIDFFSGAGGFSEGFRQQGFKIVKGIDYWEPAIKTHNLNHNLQDSPEDVLNYAGSDSGDVKQIEMLPDVDIIVGSPSCVTFSMSNRSGKADKTDGIRLIETYLRVIAVKKHKKDSNLKAWLMENVPNSQNYVKESYSFNDLNLTRWAIKEGYNPSDIALRLNGVVLNASYYGAPQNRNRFICGESTRNGLFPIPRPVKHEELKLGHIKSKIPKPNMAVPADEWQDPNYPKLTLHASEISDHFYDSGLYITDWERARYLKTMHPFMGKMAFPEDENKISRTVTATRSTSSRESLIYKSEHSRSGHGEFRSPTIREAASLMGYPYTYQFVGSEGVKWKLIGNSVSPQLSSALARAILINEGRKSIPMSQINFKTQKQQYKQIDNLNTFSVKVFDRLKIRKSGASFRRSIHKSGNITVDLMNYLPAHKQAFGNAWHVCVFYGTGSNHRYDVLGKARSHKLFETLVKEVDFLDDFVDELKEAFSDNSLTAEELQRVYEADSNLVDEQNPLVIISRLQKITDKYSLFIPKGNITFDGLVRKEFTIVQVLYMFSLSFIVYNNLHRLRPVSERMRAYEYEFRRAY
jgi:DNA (cytosine-5)-methyltransferase 1